MLNYLIILLDNTSISYCHYEHDEKESKLIPLDVLKEGIVFAMKNNLRIQYVLPSHSLPTDYLKLMESMANDKIGPIEQTIPLSAIVIDGLFNIDYETLHDTSQYVIRTTVEDFISNYKSLKCIFSRGISANIVFIDVESFKESMIENYRSILAELVCCVESALMSGMNIHTNLITDRIALDGMNNCGAGDTSITLAPDGKFYICPAFYYDTNGIEMGDLTNGLNIKSKVLFQLDHAPLCKRCDAYHCKRCVWLNKRLTYEVNTPSRQQCVMAHLEREASKTLLDNLHKHKLLTNRDIKQIDYIDPFDKF